MPGLLTNSLGNMLWNGYGYMSAVNSTGDPVVPNKGLYLSGMRSAVIVPITASSHSSDIWGETDVYIYKTGASSVITAGQYYKPTGTAMGYYIAIPTERYFRPAFYGAGVATGKLGNLDINAEGSYWNTAFSARPARSSQITVYTEYLGNNFVGRSAIMNLPSAGLTGTEQWNLFYFSSIMTGSGIVTASKIKNSAKWGLQFSLIPTVAAGSGIVKMSAVGTSLEKNDWVFGNLYENGLSVYNRFKYVSGTSAMSAASFSGNVTFSASTSVASNTGKGYMYSGTSAFGGYSRTVSSLRPYLTVYGSSKLTGASGAISAKAAFYTSLMRTNGGSGWVSGILG